MADSRPTLGPLSTPAGGLPYLVSQDASVLESARFGPVACMLQVLEEGVRPALPADAGLGSVAGPDLRFVVEGEQPVLDGFQDLAEVAPGQIGSPDASVEQGVPGEKDVAAALRDVEAEAARGMARGVNDMGGNPPNLHAIGVAHELVHGSHTDRLDPVHGEHGSLAWRR